MNSFEKIATIHHAMNRGFFVVSGAGSSLISRILTLPGGSETVLGTEILYSCKAVTDFLRREPECFSSEVTARQLATMAWRKAEQYAIGDQNARIFGFGLTTARTSARDISGDIHAFLAFQTKNRTVSYALKLKKEIRDRASEEALITDWALERIAAFCGVIPNTEVPIHEVVAPKSWERVWTGELPFVEIARDGSVTETLSPGTKGIFPGSFAPIHEGHIAMHRCAERILNGHVSLEIAVLNADKPPLDFVTVQDRLKRIFASSTFTGNRVLLTGLPLFEQKSECFGHQTFLVGIDTLERLANVRYYGNDTVSLERSLQRLAIFGTRFLVFGRAQAGEKNRSFVDFQASRFPEKLAVLCDGVPEDVFRNDISSTQIRALEMNIDRN